jgi:aspartate-semialdehyde dehydrogenase
MSIRRIGFVGWRGMVGSVLMERMRAEGDFDGLAPVFFSTSQVGQEGPSIGIETPILADAFDTEQLATLDAIVTCQGGDYTKQVLPLLRESGWQGYWIDAASSKRMDADSVIVLDPVNRAIIDTALDAGTKNLIGGNCTVALMLMALGGLFREGWVEWISAMTYQSASGAGARNMRELVQQMQAIGDDCRQLTDDPSVSSLEIDRRVGESLADRGFPKQHFGIPLAGSLIPWIDSAMPDGETREEWKGFVETNKILGRPNDISVDSLCVRVGAMRCHSQAFTIKLDRDIPLADIEQKIAEANEWVRLVPNDKASTDSQLTPAAVSGTLDIPVGRLRKMRLGPEYLSAFTVGDQLLWGAAEPLRRALNIIRARES